MADTIILVDHPLWIHYWWTMKRRFMCLFRPRPNGPKGCPMLPMTWELLKIIGTIHRNARPRYWSSSKTPGRTNRYITCVHRELRQFVREHCLAA